MYSERQFCWQFVAVFKGCLSVNISGQKKCANVEGRQFCPLYNPHPKPEKMCEWEYLIF